ncbi:MAG TPA: UDP-N-acetylmuramoyl-L-alanyl-D-glutamate--2,6-diaminopimelate ligase [Acidimicrobiia bacterium]|nr:UDP-N-acetylmuramoyl-L-alanyl-D-glutamate--2,6-diaminopimelate ligase [Acidimicrobiia bacterium]
MGSTSSAVGRLAEVVGGRVIGDSSVVVRDVTHDSRQAGPGTLFVAVPGARQDGHDHAPAAVGAGSPAVMVERPLDVPATQIVVDSTRAAMAPAAAEVHGHPSRRLDVVGVTGTNGKTTVTHMVEAIVAASGRLAGLIGTVHTRVGAIDIPNTRTTPESTDFQRLLARMVDLGANVVSTEVSSHAMEMHRVDCTRFAVAAFTNLSQDHLDFHGDMDRYFAAKARLFRPPLAEKAVVWIDDPAGRGLAASVEIPLLTVGNSGEITARDPQVGITGSRFTLVTPDGERWVELALGGGFNIDNALIAAGCAHSLGIALDDIVRGLGRFEGVPGRFETVSGDDPIRVVVDYAHTPAGIAAAVAAVRAIEPEQRIIVVFGAGGDRDRAKRPEMGAAALGADVVIVTSDNPRSEDPEAIIDEVLSGMRSSAGAHRQADRRRAIAHAVEMAQDGDLILILGRGHERGQEVAGRLLPFDDRLVAREALAARRRTRE